MMTVAIVDFGIWDALRDVLLLLVAALVLGMAATRLRQSVIVGYLLAGTLVGPSGLGWIGRQQELFYLSEMGVALLLFVIGLEFSPRRLFELGRATLGTGVLQVVVTMGAGWGVAVACGLGGRESLVIGMMVAMSSTACVLRLLTDRGELDGIHGRAALGVLLVQDVAVIPMMLVVTAMSGGGSAGGVAGKVSVAALLAVGLIGVFYVLFGVVAPRLLHQRAWLRSGDLPILLAMIMALGSAWAAHRLGLSPALGSFTAGVLLAVSPFAAQVRADVRPLSTLMVTLFFASIGMFGDPAWVVRHGLLVAGIVGAIVVGKPVLVAGIARLFGRPWRYALATGLCLAQVGEFSFVLATIAQTEVGGAALISQVTFRAMVSATIVTLLMTPYLVEAASWTGRFIGVGGRGDSGEVQTGGDDAGSEGADRVLLIGFGPAGRRVGEGLTGRYQERLVVVDLNPDNIAIAKSYGLEGVHGDATRSDVLEKAGLRRAQVVVIMLPDHTLARELIHLVRARVPGAHLIVRCRYHARQWELLMAGAHKVVSEEIEVGRCVAAHVDGYIDASGVE